MVHRAHLLLSRVLLTPAFVLLLIGATEAGADPITALYSVQVFERSFRQDAEPTVIEPFDQQFTLTMTFDPAGATGPFGYGPAAFSLVPLAIPAPPADLPLASFGSTTHIGTEEGGFFARAEGGIFGSGVVGGTFTVYDAMVRLSSSLGAASPAVTIAPGTFPVHLGLAGQDPFNFIYSSCLGIGPFPPGADSCTDTRQAGTRIVSYRGTATLNDVNVPAIPEPMTLALVGSGLAMLGRCRKRRPGRAAE